MDVTSKLRLIQEGYSLDDINTGRVDPFQISESSLSESMFADFGYIEEMYTGMLQESSNNDNIFKKFIDWIIEKIRQFKIFIADLFRKKQQESVIEKLKQKVKQPLKPFMVRNTLEDIILYPEEAYNNLVKLVEQFESENVNNIVRVYKRKAFDPIFMRDADVSKAQIVIWKKITNENPSINYYDGKVTGNVIDYTLNKRPTVRIHTQEQLTNIIDFAENFYELWKFMNKALSYFEYELKRLKDFSHNDFRVIRLSCETMMYTFPEILNHVNGYIHGLSVIEPYID